MGGGRRLRRARARSGKGTFGTVWRVRDLSLEREVALKMLHPNVASDESAVARFRREARLAAQLAHPAIVPIYDWDSRGDVSWYTMELAEGGSVADLITRNGPRPFAEIAPQVDSGARCARRRARRIPSSTATSSPRTS